MNSKVFFFMDWDCFILYNSILFLQEVKMDSTNLYGPGHIHRGMPPNRAIHNDMLVYHSNKLHVVKVPVVVQEQLIDAIPVVRSLHASEYQAVHAFDDSLARYSGKTGSRG